jgi:hypothetical protein
MIQTIYKNIADYERFNVEVNDMLLAGFKLKEFKLLEPTREGMARMLFALLESEEGEEDGN